MSKITILRSLFEQIINNIDSGNTNLSDEEAEELIITINNLTNAKNKLSKYQACKYLHISRATFDNWVREGKIPAGRKEQGFTEKFWYKEDLIKCQN